MTFSFNFTYPDCGNIESCGPSSDGVLFKNNPVPNSTKFIGELWYNNVNVEELQILIEISE